MELSLTIVTHVKVQLDTIFNGQTRDFTETKPLPAALTSPMVLGPAIEAIVLTPHSLTLPKAP